MRHRSFSRGSFQLLVVALATAVLAGVCRADEVKLGEFWIPNVTIISLTDGQLLYETGVGGEVSRSLDDLVAVKLDTAPALAEAEAKYAGGEYADAARLFAEAEDQVRQDDRAAWIKYRLMQAHAAGGDAYEAGLAYLDLLRNTKETWYYERMPRDVMAKLSDRERDRLVRRLEGGARFVQGRDAKAAIEKLLGIVRGAADEPAEDDAPETVPPRNGGGTATPTRDTPAADDAEGATDESAVVLPEPLKDESHPAVAMLKAGDFAEAREMLLAEVQERTDTSLSTKLYLLGLAQLYLADQSGDAEDYKEAGVWFAWMTSHFGRARRSLNDAAEVEMMYIHHKLNRDDIARRLYDGLRVRLTEEDDPAYKARMDRIAKLIGQPASDAE